MSSRIYIVDPLSSGSLLAPRARDLFDMESVAILSKLPIFEGLVASFIPCNFSATLHSDSLHELIAMVEESAGGPPQYLVCGSETGVELYDQLCAYWGLDPNGPNRASARRDKYLMQAALRSAGLNYIPFTKGSDLSKIAAWCEQHTHESFVVKPLKSFGTDGVHFCSSVDEVRSAMDGLIGATNYAGFDNEEVLVETYIGGPEYVVDTVSSHGSHFVVNMFRYSKATVDGNPIYRTMTAVDPASQPELASYVKKALDALGVESGPSHSELIVSASGPVLVESGTRMHGGQGPRLVDIAFSHSLVDLTLYSRVSPDEYARATENPSRLRVGVTECFLSSRRSGDVVNVFVDDICQPLESFRYHTVGLRPGDRVSKTVDLITSYGRVVLAHEDPQRLGQDVQRVLEADQDGALLSLR